MDRDRPISNGTPPCGGDYAGRRAVTHSMDDLAMAAVVVFFIFLALSGWHINSNNDTTTDSNNQTISGQQTIKEAKAWALSFFGDANVTVNEQGDGASGDK